MNKNISIVSRIVRLFLGHRQLGILVLVGIVFLGVFGFWGMPKQYNPEITAPAFMITTEYPGATALEVQEWITKPMENSIREISSLDTASSFSFDGGVSRVLVKFEVGENEEDAKIVLSQKLQSNFFLKPKEALDPLVETLSPDDVPIATIALVSDELSPESLRKAGYDLVDFLGRIPDVSGVGVYGGEQSVYEVVIDAKKASSLRIDITQIPQIISDHNRYARVGNIQSDEISVPVRVWGFPETTKDLGALVISEQEGSLIRLRDIAEVHFGNTEPSSQTSFLFSGEAESKNAVYVAISKKKGSNATAVTKRIHEKIEELGDQKFFPEFLSIEFVRDEGLIAQEEVYGLTGNLFLSIGIVSIIIFLFLGWRSAFVILVSIPLTLAIVFFVGYLFGQTINRITLFALILSLGLLVDSAIVVVENIHKKLSQKDAVPDEETVIRAVDEVGVGLFLSTVTTILAFVPMAFVTGMMGPYMGPIPFFVPMALLGALFIAYTINPMMFRWIALRFGIGREKKPWASYLLERLREGYGHMMQKLLDSQKIRRGVLLGVVFALLASFLLIIFAFVPFRMLPKADKEQFFVYLDMPEYTTFEKTQEVSDRVARALGEYPEVKSVQIFTGTPAVEDFNGLFQGSFLRSGVYQSTLRVRLTHPDERKERSQDIVAEIRKEMLEWMEGDVVVRFIEDPPGPPVASTYRLGIFSDNEALRERVAQDLVAFSRTQEGVVDRDTTLSQKTKAFSFRVDTQKADALGIPVGQITKTMEILFGETEVSLLHAFQGERKSIPEQEPILIRTQEIDRDSKDDLDSLLISDSEGNMILLSSLLISEEEDRPDRILSEDYQPVEYIGAEMDGRSVVYAMIEILPYLVKEYPLIENQLEVEKWSLLGVTYKDTIMKEKIEVRLMGEWELTLEVFRDLGIAFGISILAIFFVLALQFRSLFIPLLIMGTIPFALIGVLPGFALLYAIKGTFFNATSMIGVIALSGIVVNNAIIYLEYFSQEKKRQKDLKETLIQTGKARLAPIVLTSLTTILGTLTIASDPVWEGLAWSIIWGLSLSALLTLVIFPLLLFETKRFHS